jgi:hypothetical protein
VAGWKVRPWAAFRGGVRPCLNVNVCHLLLMCARMHGEGAYTDADGVEWKGQFYNGKYFNGKAYVALR